ncbi:hypothetical protein WAI453_007437 [Rhynchosporium graminicola]
MAQTLDSEFEMQVRRAPDAVAVDAWDGLMIYSELDQHAQTLAGTLQIQGLQPQDLIPIIMGKSVWGVVALLAVLKAGGAFVLIDVGTPTQRMQEILSQLNAPFVITRSGDERMIGIEKTRVVYADQDTPGQETLGLAQKHGQKSLAYAVFTSGSTGRPKGILMEHEAATTNIRAIVRALNLTSSTRLYQFSSYNFGICIIDHLSVLLAGGCLCIPSEDQRQDSLEQSIHSFRASHMIMTPTVAKLLQPMDLPHLRSIVVGGEFLAPGLVEILSERYHITFAYGLSEAVNITTTNPDVQKRQRMTDLGESLGHSIWIVDIDDHNQLVKDGSVGELVLGGKALFRSYLNDEQATAKALISQPVWAVNEVSDISSTYRFFKTGDLVRKGKDGTLHLIGRKDSQVKIRGQRVELSDVEAHLQSIFSETKASGVACVAIADPNQNNATTLVALLELPQSEHGQQEPHKQDELPLIYKEKLTHQLPARVPKYMVPQYSFAITNFPKLLTGKVDRMNLQNQARSMVDAFLQSKQIEKSLKMSDEPCTPTEQLLKSLWLRTLDSNETTATIDLDDNFFELGGDSATTMRLAHLAQSEGCSLSVSEILGAPRLRDMAKRIKTSLCSAGKQEQSHVSIPPFELIDRDLLPTLREEAAKACMVDIASIEDLYPATPFQEGLIALSATSRGAYVGHFAIDLPSEIDTQRFCDAWESVEREFPIFRTRIVNTAAGCMQVVFGEVAPWVYDGHDPDFIQMSYGDRLTERALIRRRGQHVFYYSAHHATYDGWSIQLVLKALNELYRGLTVERHYPYNAFIRHLREKDHQEVSAFWERYLDNAQPTRLPVRRDLGTTSSKVLLECEHKFELPIETNSSVTKATIMQLAWAIVLSSRTDLQDVLMSITLSGRDDMNVHGIGNIVGPTVTSIPLRVRLDPETSVSATLTQLVEERMEMMPFVHLGMSNIQRLNAEVRECCNFNCHMVIQLKELSNDAPELFHLRHAKLSTEPHTYALLLNIYPQPEGLRVVATYDNEVIPDMHIRFMLFQLEHVAQQLVRCFTPRHGLQSLKIGEINTLSPEEQQQLHEWSAKPYKIVERCLHDAFRDQVSQYPEKMAVESWDGGMTYSEVDHYSDKVAQHLRILGVEKGDRVMVVFEKCRYVPTAILAILKAGAVFVMVDNDHPMDRISTMADVAGADFAIVSQSCSELVSGVVSKILILDQDGLNRLPLAPSVLETPVAASDPAYVIFTSGSTGVPKGCVVNHRSYATGAFHQRQAMLIGPQSRSLQFASYGFGTSLIELLSVLLAGGTVCIPSAGDRLHRLADFVVERRANWSIMTPSLACVLDPKIFTSIKTLVVCGEALTQDHIYHLADRVNLRQIYGQAETSGVFTATERISRKADCRNIGKPMAGRCCIVRASRRSSISAVPWHAATSTGPT